MADGDALVELVNRLMTGGNKLLAITEPADLQFLARRGGWRTFARGDVLSHANQPSDAAYFIASGIASMIKSPDGQRPTEICLIGPEGFIGAPIVLADGRCPYQTFVQSEMLSAFRVSADDLRSLVADSASFLRTLLNAIHVQTVQVAENLVSAAWQRTGVRLARWLLMYHDRIGSPQLEVTHEFVAMMICAQRTKVTEALHDIEAEGAIIATRGRIMIKDVAILERLADGTYGCAEAEARRLFLTRKTDALRLA